MLFEILHVLVTSYEYVCNLLQQKGVWHSSVTQISILVQHEWSSHLLIFQMYVLCYPGECNITGSIQNIERQGSMKYSFMRCKYLNVGTWLGTGAHRTLG